MTQKTAIVYHYFERNARYRENLIFFLVNGLHDNADFFIIISGECSVALPDIHNVTYIRTRNWNHDFGGYIKFVKEFFSDSYDYFMFINSSVRGPFLPAYVRGRWDEIFTGKLQGDVKLVGASINILPEDHPYSKIFASKFDYVPLFSHVQTTAYALTRESLKYLIKLGFYEIYHDLSKEEVIAYYEIRLSQEIIRRGWNIGTVLPVYDDLDYRDLAMRYPNPSSVGGDVLYSGAFFGRTVSPIEGIFIKINRNMVSARDLASYTFTSLYQNGDRAATSPGALDLLEDSYKAVQAPPVSGRQPFSLLKSLKAFRRRLFG